MIKAIKISTCKKIMFSCIYIFCHFIIHAQTIYFEAPTIILDHTENELVATLNLSSGETELTGLNFIVSFDSSVLKLTGESRPNSFIGGILNPIQENEVVIGLFFIEDTFGGIEVPYIDGLINLHFDYIVGGGTESPISISLTEIFDVDDNELSASTVITNGSVSKTCAATPINGCTNFNYEEYNPLADCEDGTCSTLICRDNNFQKITQYDNYTAALPDLSSSGNRVVFIDDGNVKLFEALNNSWEQIGPDLPLDFTSYGISLSGAGDKIAFISWDNFTSPQTYYVKSYFLIDNQWVKTASDIISNSSSIRYATLSNDGNTLLVHHWEYIPDNGRIEMFELVNSEWQKKGDDFLGPIWYPQITDDGNTILFSDNFSGTVNSSIYSYNGSNWVAKGSLVGNTASFNLDNSGNSILKIEYPTPYINPDLTFYEYDGSSWIQSGTTQSFIGSVGNIMTGDLSNFTITDRNNFIEIYKYNGFEWNNVNTLTYENNEFRFWNCQFSQDGNALLVRGYYHDNDDVGLTAYYANDCNNVNERFCVDTQVLNGVIDSDTYKSGNKINARGTVDLNSGGDVEFESQNSVELLSGFSAGGDVNFEIRMRTCDPNN